MNPYVFEPGVRPSAAVEGSHARFPLARVFCLGRNYPWSDSDSTPRSEPLFFMKPASSVIEAGDALAFPPLTEAFCHEIELVVAMGKEGAHLTVDSALDHVWGYAAGLDLTRRDLQLVAKAAGQPWECAKAFDGSAPITPIVPVSVCGHPQAGAIWLKVNGVERQRSDLQRQTWSVAEVISLISRYVTLQAGDLIMTGTPAGVDTLAPGDLIDAGIDGIGRIAVRVGPMPSSHPFNLEVGESHHAQ